MSARDARKPLSRWSLPGGQILRRVLRDDSTQEYLCYVPSSGGQDAPILASVHGISRNAYQQATVFSPYCERFGIVLVVPRFTPGQHKDYQRLGRRGRGTRADFVLDRCISEVSSLTGADATRINLFGYSGGAQFAHRYVLAHPHRVTRAVVAAAGWYTMPDHRRRFPYGIRSTAKLPGVSFNPEEFLHVPIHALVGTLDKDDQNLRHTDRLDRQQGRTRVERARNWTDAMAEASILYGISPTVKFTEVAGIDHSFTRFCGQGALVKRVFQSLFDVSIEPAAQPTKVNGTAPDPDALPSISSMENDIVIRERRKI